MSNAANDANVAPSVSCPPSLFPARLRSSITRFIGTAVGGDRGEWGEGDLDIELSYPVPDDNAGELSFDIVEEGWGEIKFTFPLGLVEDLVGVCVTSNCVWDGEYECIRGEEDIDGDEGCLGDERISQLYTSAAFVRGELLRTWTDSLMVAGLITGLWPGGGDGAVTVVTECEWAWVCGWL
jgi:hypothetical protein